MILIVGSEHDDVLYFRSILKDAKEEVILNKYRALTGTILNQSVMVLQDIFTSYVSSAVLTYIIEKYYVLMVFCVGTCFSQTKDLKVGDVVISEYSTFGDVDQIRMLKGTGLGQIPGYPRLFYSHKELLKNMEDALNTVGSSYSICGFMNSSYYRKDQTLIEELSLEDQIEYEIILGLRLLKGIDLKEFETKYHQSLYDIYDLQELIHQGLLVEENNHIKIPENALYVSNEIMVQILQKRK